MESRTTICRQPWDVVGLGVVAVDDLIYVQNYPAADTKVQVLNTSRQCGGLTATALVAAARLGARCAYAGVMGTDDASVFAADQLAHEGIDLNFSQRRPGAEIYHSRIVVDATDNSRTIFSDGRGVVGAAEDAPSEDFIRATKVLFVDHVGLAGMLRAARIAQASGIPIVSDLERNTGPEFDELCGLVDHFIVSEEFASKLTGESDLAKATRLLSRHSGGLVAVTAGNRGCWYASSSTQHTVRHQPAYPVQVVDTTGCGDVFHGAYAAALAFGLQESERFRIAAAAAAIKATAPGGQAGTPHWSILQAFLREKDGRGVGEAA